jgi:hypothetical protein
VLEISSILTLTGSYTHRVLELSPSHPYMTYRVLELLSSHPYRTYRVLELIPSHSYIDLSHRVVDIIVLIVSLLHMP